MLETKYVMRLRERRRILGLAVPMSATAIANEGKEEIEKKEEEDDDDDDDDDDDGEEEEEGGGNVDNDLADAGGAEVSCKAFPCGKRLPACTLTKLT